MISRKAIPVVGLLLAGIFSNAQAGQFSTICTYSSSNLSECADVIADIVTEKFTQRFSSANYRIFIHSSALSFTDGGWSIYAVAGVVPGKSYDFPAIRFSRHGSNGSNYRPSALELGQNERKIVRAAVQDLMDECELSPTCEVYRQR